MENESRQLVYNAIKCKKCGTVLVSRSRHDFQACKCPKRVTNDGGLAYRHVGYSDEDNIENLCVYDDAPIEQIREVFAWGSYGKNGDKPLRYILLKDISDTHLSKILETQWHISKYILDVFMLELEYRADNGIIVPNNDIIYIFEREYWESNEILGYTDDKDIAEKLAKLLKSNIREVDLNKEFRLTKGLSDHVNLNDKYYCVQYNMKTGKVLKIDEQNDYQFYHVEYTTEDKYKLFYLCFAQNKKEAREKAEIRCAEITRTILETYKKNPNERIEGGQNWLKII